jgi:hypothetical protein
VGRRQHRPLAHGDGRVPRDVPHEVRNESDEVVRFVGVYASADVVTTYVTAVQPDGEQRRRPLG